MDTKKNEVVATVIEVAIKLGVLFGVLVISFLIIKPFIGLILWSIILAVALSPLVNKTAKRLHVKKKKVLLAGSFLIVTALIIPAYTLSDKAVDSISSLSHVVKNGEFSVPPPDQNVKEWPLIGEKTYELWESASKNLTQTLQPFSKNIKQVAKELIATIGESLKMILFSIVAIIIAAFLLKDEERYAKIYKDISKRLIGERGEEWANLSALTIRSVANGIIGVAVIQATFALLGLVAMDVPFAILIAIIVMFLTIVQLPAIIIIGPVVGFVLSKDTSTTAIIFSIYMIVVGAMDGVLKPLLMGRGVDIPMLVVLIGAIGGMLLMGMIGLFVGAVIFALAYKLFKLWMAEVEFASD